MLSQSPQWGSHVTNDFDDILWEMAVAVGECGKDVGSMKAMVEGWVEMEDNEFCTDMLAEKVNGLMAIDSLCNLRGNAGDEANNDEDDSEDDEEEQGNDEWGSIVVDTR